MTYAGLVLRLSQLVIAWQRDALLAGESRDYLNRLEGVKNGYRANCPTGRNSCVNSPFLRKGLSLGQTCEKQLEDIRS